MHLMVIHCVTAEHDGLIKNKERKESSSVKLKAFRLTSGGLITYRGIMCHSVHTVHTAIIQATFSMPKLTKNAPIQRQS